MNAAVLDQLARAYVEAAADSILDEMLREARPASPVAPAQSPTDAAAVPQ